MPLEAAIILGVLVAALVFAVIFIIKAVRGAHEQQKVSEAQKRISVGHWYALGKSKRRRNRVRSRLPEPTPGDPRANETFVWVTGLARARFWFLMVPVILAIPLVVFLWVKAADLYAHPYVISGSGVVSGTLKLNNLGGFMLSLIAWLVTVASCVYAVIAYLRWSGVYVALSAYRILLIRVYPVWAFRMKSYSTTLELSDITSAEYERSMSANAFGYATIRFKAASKDSSLSFDDLQFIPNGHLRAAEIDKLQKVALPPQQRAETDRMVKAMNDGFDRVVQKLDEKPAPYSPAQEPSGEDEADDTADSEETQEVTQVES